MSGSKFNYPWRNYHPQRVEVIGAALIGALFVAYFALLHVLDGRAESYFQRLRVSNPAHYLTLLRESEGFDAYLAEYRTLEGYADFRPAPPSFLVGRWTMRSGPVRLTPGTAPTECSDPVTLDYGLILQLETGGVALPVNYRIVGKTVELRANGNVIIPVRLISYGAQLDHIEFTPPGETTQVYAYLCGR